MKLSYLFSYGEGQNTELDLKNYLILYGNFYQKQAIVKKHKHINPQIDFIL